MAKYDDYIINPPVSRFTVSDDGRTVFNGFFLVPDQIKHDFLIGHQIITKTMKGDNPAHYHNHHEVLFWLGANPDAPGEFKAKVRLYLGEDMEEHIFTKPTAVVLPPGLVHAPLDVFDVEGPIIQIEMMFAAEDGSERTRVPFFPEDADFYDKHKLVISHDS